MATEGNVVFRTIFFERLNRFNKDTYRFLPFYMVTMPEMHGKLFEPVDCFGRVNPNNPVKGYKEVNALVEFDGRAKMFHSEINPDGQDCQLHKFQSWDWPVN